MQLRTNISNADIYAMSNGIIYLITNTVNGKQYVGFTTNSISKRWEQHVLDAYRKKPHSEKQLLHLAIVKYGAAYFDIQIVAIYDDPVFALKVAEPFFVSFYN